MKIKFGFALLIIAFLFSGCKKHFFSSIENSIWKGKLWIVTIGKENGVEIKIKFGKNNTAEFIQKVADVETPALKGTYKIKDKDFYAVFERSTTMQGKKIISKFEFKGTLKNNKIKGSCLASTKAGDKEPIVLNEAFEIERLK